MKPFGYHRRTKIINDEYGWISVMKNASTTMEYISDEAPYDSDRTYIAIIRNPFERLVSCWENKQEYFMQDTFEQFIEYCCKTEDGYINPHAQSQVAFLEPYPDKFILFDNFVEELKGLGIEVPFHHNKTSYPQPWLEYYTPQIMKRIEERYREDLKLFEQILKDRTA